MYLDGYLQFSNGQLITVTAPSTNVLDMLNARDMGIGDEPSLELAILVTTALAGGTSLQVQIQGSVDNSAWITYAESRAYLTAELIAGAKLLPITVPSRILSDPVPRYYRLNFIVAGTYTSGAVTAYIVVDREDRLAYPAGINILN